MSTIRGVKDRRFKFVQLLNSMFEDPNLSLKAKGFIGYCLTKKEDWKFHINHLCTALLEGEKAIYSVINECIEKGYALRYQQRAEHGDFMPWETIVSDSKHEIAEIKKELEATEEFQKKFALRHFGEPQKSGPQKDPPSNTDLSNDISKDISTEERNKEAKPPAAKAAPIASAPFKTVDRSIKLSADERELLLYVCEKDQDLLDKSILRYQEWKASTTKSKLPKSDYAAIRKWAIDSERKARAEAKRTELMEKQNAEMERRLNSPKSKGGATYTPPTHEQAQEEALKSERKPSPPMSIEQRMTNMKLYYQPEEWPLQEEKIKKGYEQELKEFNKKWK